MVFLTQTPWGRQWVLREVLRRVEAVTDGEIQVAGISSPGLLRGFTFQGIRILDRGGRPFLIADSLRAGLSPRSLLGGDLVFSRVEIWTPRVHLEQFSSQERMNVLAIFLPGGGGEGGSLEPAGGAVEEGPEAGATRVGEAGSGVPPADSLPQADQAEAGPNRVISLQGVRIHDGWLNILLPGRETTGRGNLRPLVEANPHGGTPLHRYTFREIQAHLSQALIRAPGQRGERFEVASLSLVGEVWEKPFRVTELRGRVTRLPGRLQASLEELRLPKSELQGEVEVEWGGGRGATISAEAQARGLALEDLHWIEPRLGRGRGEGPVGFELGPRGVRLLFQDTRLELPRGRARLSGGLLLGEILGLEDLLIGMEEVALEVLDPWLPEPLPLRTRVTGDLELSGNPGALGILGALSLQESVGGAATEMEVSGVLHLQDSLSFTGFHVTLAPLEWETFSSLHSSLTLKGPGALRVDADGSLQRGILLDLEANHTPVGLSPSRVAARGTLRQTADDLILELDGELGPLSFTTLSRDFPDLPLTGEISGPFSLQGPFSRLRVETELTTSAGPLTLLAEVDALNPRESYLVDAEVEEFLLSGLLPGLPDPTRLTGHLLASGSGVALDSLRADATLFLRRGEVGALRVDTAALIARADRGLLTVDALMAETNVGRVEGGGAFGISPGAPPGELVVRVASESLEPLRPFILGEVPVILDELTPMERDWLVLGGASLDTIPTAAEVAMGGAIQGQGIFRGGISEFSGEGTVEFQGLTYRTEFAQAGSLIFQATGLPGPERRVQARVRTDSLLARGQAFRAGELEVDVGSAEGRVNFSLEREGNEEYRGRGTFALDPVSGGTVNLDELLIRFDTVRWNLGGPTSVTWSPDGVDVRDFRLIRPGVGMMRIRADGYLPFRGEGGFDLEVEGLHLERLARLSQMETPLEGEISLRLSMAGTAEDPVMEGSFNGNALRFGPLTLEGVASDLSYRGERLSGRIQAREGGREVLAVEGQVPVDLSVRTQGPRIPEAPVELEFQVDSFPAALALAVLEVAEEVEGSLTGDIRLAGTPADLQPSGEVTLSRGRVFLWPLGVRYRDVESTFTLNPDARVDVEGSLRSRGIARISGSVTLSPLTNPVLDLTLRASDFQAVARRDVTARVTGDVQVHQNYRRPRVQGSLTLDRSELRVEELARSAEVVDLSDPAFLDVVEGETSLRPILEASQNPFLQNLMLDVQVGLTRDSWLRGKDLNVEMGGNLQVFWDRTERDLALVGDLQAVRGSYTFLGRQFQVQEGTVSFLGTPGVNPKLDIQALHRLRTQEDTRLDITATVSGDLVSPRVSLSSNISAIAESDLVSYLVFGRPSYALSSGQSRWAGGVAGSLLGAAGEATANFALGTISSQLGTVVARDFGLDYLAISQGDLDPFGTLGWSGTVASTQVEIGQYITDDVFAALLWRPLSNLDPASGLSQFAGLRVEWQVADLWTLEGFYEDRFNRSPLFRAGSLGYRSPKMGGFFFWREWGY